MPEQYCIAMMNMSRKKEEHTLPLLLSEEDKPFLYGSLEEAVKIAKGLKQWHQEIKFEIREFYGLCKYVFEMMQIRNLENCKRPSRKNLIWFRAIARNLP